MGWGRCRILRSHWAGRVPSRPQSGRDQVPSLVRVVVLLLLTVPVFCNALPPRPGGGRVVRGPVVTTPGVRGGGARTGFHGGRVHRNVHQGPDSLHRPWAGSDTYDKNLNRSKDGGRSDFQRDRDATLDVYHGEEDRARRIAHEEAARAEKMQNVRENKAVIDAQNRAAAAERKAREAERNAELRARAAEQERETVRRRAEQEKVHDAVLSALPTCIGRNADGTPCTRKANPGHHCCALHISQEQNK